MKARYSIDGRPRLQHALAQLSLSDRDLLDASIAISEQVDDLRRTALWNLATDRAVNGELRPRRLA
jgi:hypothetical protein